MIHPPPEEVVLSQCRGHTGQGYKLLDLPAIPAPEKGSVIHDEIMNNS